MLGKRSFAAATSLIAIVGLINMSGQQAEPEGFTDVGVVLSGEGGYDQDHLDMLREEYGGAGYRVKQQEQLVRDLHSSYLQRDGELDALTIVQPTAQAAFQTQSFNVWRAPDFSAAQNVSESLFSHIRVNCGTRGSYEKP